MPEFKVGDRVVAHKPDDVDEAPSWVEQMDVFDGRELTVIDVYDSGFTYANVLVNESQYSFNTKWLTHTEEFEGNV